MLKVLETNKGNGSLILHLGAAGAFRKLEIVGGPYDGYTPKENTFGVCVRAEHVRPNDVHVAIRDFDIPRDDNEVALALIAAFEAALDGKDVYVGCMGGWGRTGLFLALMAKVAGYSDPVTYVRDTYTPNAVETRPQQNYVRDFDIELVRKVVLKKAWISTLPFLRYFL